MESRLTGTGPKTGPAAMDQLPVSGFDSHGFLSICGVGGESIETAVILSAIPVR